MILSIHPKFDMWMLFHYMLLVIYKYLSQNTLFKGGVM